MTEEPFPTSRELEAGLEGIAQAPPDEGQLKLIVRRPAIEQREILERGELVHAEGLAGDRWGHESRARRADQPPDPDTQLTLMNARAIALLARDEGRWPLAGDQLFVEMDLSLENLPPGTRLTLGDAVIEVTGVPHLGCRKFAARFGSEALKFVNSPEGKHLRLRGMYARVIRPGAIRLGDVLKKT
jgi:MOSC domain-containing protein YiiM